MTALRAGVRLGVDVGTVRIGVARSDPDGVMTLPVATVHRDNRTDVGQVLKLARQFEVIEVVVGLPKHLAGVEGASAAGARRYAARLRRGLRDQVRVCLVDERLSSKQAHERLRQAGVPERQQRAMVDQVAAQIILEQALQEERVGGHAPGITVEHEGK